MFGIEGITLQAMRYLLLLFILLGNAATIIAGQYHYRYTENCSEAYRYFMALKPEAGREKIKKDLIADPYNLMATYVSDYEDCLLLLFNGNRQDYEQLKGHQYDRLKLMERGDDSSPWHRLCQAGIYMHWAFVHVRFNENLKAGTNFRKSFLLLKENQRMFPGFEYDDIFLGIEEAVVGSLPDNYKWIASILGMKGNIHNGASKLKKFIQKHDDGEAFYNEAVIYYAYINYYILADKDEAWATVNSKSFDVSDNLVNSFVKINIAINYRKAAVARNILQQVADDNYYNKYPIFDYEYGYALLHGLDAGAVARFRKFLDNYKGSVFVKDAWQKMAYAYYLQGNTKMAEYCKKKILTAGGATTDSDKQALRFAQNNRWPDATLLKVQLLTDGGYYHQAEKVISGTTINDYATVPLQSEYYFRLARVNEELGNRKSAITYYTKAIEIGTGRPEQFAARSALMAGLLYEKMMQKDNALKMFRLALSMEGHDFQNSIDQQAKSGINRLSE
jgi:tetratricopeptide (TPR) repeat protein